MKQISPLQKKITPLRSSMQPTLSSMRNHAGFLLTIILLTSPYFIIRIPNTSFYVADLFLVLGLLIFFLNRTRVGLLRSYHLPIALLSIGSLFIIASLVSGIEGLIFIGADFSMSSLVSGIFQYAFVLLLLPLLSNWLITANCLWSFFRVISLGYLPPMLVTLGLMHPSASEPLREYFFIAGRATGTFGNANAFAGVLAIMIPIYTVLAIADKGCWKLLGTIGVVLSLICLLLTASFGGILTFLLLIIVNLVMSLLWHSYPTRQYKRGLFRVVIIVLFLGSSLGLLLGSQWSSGQISDRISIATEVFTQVESWNDLGSASLRLDLIREAIDLIESRFGGLWGHGLRQSTIVSLYSVEVHVLYLLLWIEGGFVLLLLFLSFFAIMANNVFHLAILDPLAAIAVGFGVLALACFGLLNPHIYLRFYWIPLLPAFVDWREYHS